MSEKTKKEVIFEMKTYQGQRLEYSAVVEVISSDGSVKNLDPERSQAIKNLDPDGFDWGYDGGKPAQLALAILLDVTNDAKIALKHYKAFKDATVRHLSKTWELSEDAVRTWLIVVDMETEVARDGKPVA